MGVGGQCYASATLPLGKSPSIFCTGGWVGLKADRDVCGKSHLCWRMNPEPSGQQGIPILIELYQEMKNTEECKISNV
jgi:hypothetical protein